MISDLERLAALHQNGQLDDAEFKLAKEKLLTGGGGTDQIALRLELTEAQIKLSENEKNWTVKAKELGGLIYDDGSTLPPSRVKIYLLLVTSLFLVVISVFSAWLLWDFSKMLSVFFIFMGMFVVFFQTSIMVCAAISYKTTLQRFLDAQSEHNAEQSALRTRIVELQQQLT